MSSPHYWSGIPRPGCVLASSTGMSIPRIYLRWSLLRHFTGCGYRCGLPRGISIVVGMALQQRCTRHIPWLPSTGRSSYRRTGTLGSPMGRMLEARVPSIILCCCDGLVPGHTLGALRFLRLSSPTISWSGSVPQAQAPTRASEFMTHAPLGSLNSVGGVVRFMAFIWYPTLATLAKSGRNVRNHLALSRLSFAGAFILRDSYTELVSCGSYPK